MGLPLRVVLGGIDQRLLQTQLRDRAAVRELLRVKR